MVSDLNKLVTFDIHLLCLLQWDTRKKLSEGSCELNVCYGEREAGSYDYGEREKLAATQVEVASQLDSVEASSWSGCYKLPLFCRGFYTQ